MKKVAKKASSTQKSLIFREELLGLEPAYIALRNVYRVGGTTVGYGPSRLSFHPALARYIYPLGKRERGF